MPDDLDIPRPGDEGLSIVPNLNVSTRQLPERITTAIFERKIALDGAQTVKFPGDRQLLPLSIVRRQLDVTGGEVATLSISGFPHRLYDKLGKRIAPTFERESEHLCTYVFEMETRAALNLFLEVVHPSGVPKATGTFLVLRLFVTNPIFTPDIALDAEGQKTALDRKDVLVAPIHFISNLQPVEKLFICTIDGNTPTVSEVEAALATAGFSHVLRKIPEDVSEGDTWLQDQFEVGFCEDHRGNRIHMVVHLPRLRPYTADANKKNLATFVDHYFPSRGIGLCRDFWERDFTVNVRGAAPITVAFRNTFAIALAFTLVEKLWSDASSFLALLGAKIPEAEEPKDIAEKLRYSTGLMAALATAYRGSTRQTPLLQSRLDFLVDLHGTVRTNFPDLYSDGARANITGIDNITVVSGPLTAAEMNRLHEDLTTLHESVNYGGNMEVCPPEPGERGGRVVIGSSPDREVDPALMSFLERQSGQGPLAIDTSWLAVGHVDELIAFVPAPKTSRRWAVLQNSSELGLRILLEAARFHFEQPDLDIDETDWQTINGPNSVNLGRAGEARFVSQVLRGRYWEYFFDRQFGPVPQLMPPLMCLETVINPPDPATRKDVYPANMSILRVLGFEKRSRTNRNLAENQLDTLTKLLGDELEANVFMMPVLYDLPEDNRYETFLPNMINLVVVGNHLLIPKPVGPRMAVNDAIAVLKKVMTPDDQAHLTPAFVRKHGLETQVMNIRGFAGTDYYEEILLSHIVDVFPDTGPDFGEKVVQANRTAFRGDTLKPGWQRLTIPEKTVDLFELYAAALVARLGLTAHFIDTWGYHEHRGGLHCGTNTIRAIPT